MVRGDWGWIAHREHKESTREESTRRGTRRDAGRFCDSILLVIYTVLNFEGEGGGEGGGGSCSDGDCDGGGGGDGDGKVETG